MSDIIKEWRSIHERMDALESIINDAYETSLKNLRKELKQDIRSYVDHALLEREMRTAREKDREPGHYPNAYYPQVDPLHNHGSKWTALEERQLNKEIEMFLNKTAKSHGRSEEAIKLRIHKQRLLW